MSASLISHSVQQYDACLNYEGSVFRVISADKSLARPGRKQARKHIRDAYDFAKNETRAVIKFFFFFLQGKAPKEIHAILTETLACFLPFRAKDLSASLYSILSQDGDCILLTQQFRCLAEYVNLLTLGFVREMSYTG